MGKGDRRSKAKRGKASFEDAVALAPTPRKQPNGRARRTTESGQDPRKSVLGARCRAFGDEDTRGNRKRHSGQHSGSQIGMVMQLVCHPDEIGALWSTWQGFCAAERTYRLRILGMSVSAKGAAIAMVPDRMETDQSHSVDTRDPETRDRDTVSAWMRWRGCVGHLSAADRQLLHAAEREDGAALWADESATRIGLRTLAALRVMRDVVQGKV